MHRTPRSGQKQAAGNIIVPRPPGLVTVSLRELLDKHFDAPGWVIPDLLPVGFTILAAPPKIGKSYLALGLVLRVAYHATGEQGLGGLYLSLDDPSERRLQVRTLDILDGRPLESGAWFATMAMDLDGGLTAQIDAWLRENPGVRIVVIDALGTVKAKRSSDDVFKSDYQGLHGLQALALDRNVAVLLIHHTRKMPGGDDWVNRISGTLGIAAMADALWLLDRPRGSTSERLFVTCRDAHDTVLDVPLDDLLEGKWLPIGEDQGKAVFLVDQVLAAITESGPEGTSVRALVASLKITRPQADQAIRKLHQAGRVTRLRQGQYIACLDRFSQGATSPDVERHHSGIGNSAARLDRFSPSAISPDGTGADAQLLQNMCNTVCVESAISPDGTGADAQPLKSVQPSGDVCPDASSPGGSGPDASQQKSVQPGGEMNGHHVDAVQELLDSVCEGTEGTHAES